MTAHTYRPATIEEARQLHEMAGNPETVKPLQFWYNTADNLVMVLVVIGDHPEFGAIQVVDTARSIIDLYARRDFERFVYAPMILEKI